MIPFLDLHKMNHRFEKEFIEQALKLNTGKINQTALKANIPKKTLLRKIEKYEINPKGTESEVSFKVDMGSSLSEISQNLEKEDIIRSSKRKHPHGHQPGPGVYEKLADVGKIGDAVIK